MTHSPSKIITILGLSISLTACGAMGRIADIGKAPDMSPMQNVQAPHRGRSIALNMPSQSTPVTEPNSLWRTGAQAFFGDQRAASIGDIITVMIDINDSAQVGNSTSRSRTTGETSNITSGLGLESKLSSILPEAVDPTSLTDFGSSSANSGSGTVNRSEAISLQVAAIIDQILPNGNMVIQGRQEVRVNFEVRELLISGIIRPEDISRFNTISHSQIAEARISYGGHGQLTDMQQSRYGAQLYEILFPF